VTRFAPRSPGPPCGIDSDAGAAYLEQLARSRAIDAARRRKRRGSLVFSQLDSPSRTPFAETIIGADAEGTAASYRYDLVCEAVLQLEPRQRLLVELLLAGKSRAMIAHVFEVTEGTVSRLRSRAIESLRQILNRVDS